MPADPVSAEAVEPPRHAEPTAPAARPKPTSKPAPAAAPRSLRPVVIGAAVVIVVALVWAFWPGGTVTKSADPAKLNDTAALARVADALTRRVAIGPASAAIGRAAASPAAAGASTTAPEWVFSVVTRPAGAAVKLDGRELPGSTPLEVSLVSDRRYTVAIERAGYEPVRWAFVPADLPQETRSSRQLFFALGASAAPADDTPAPAPSEPAPAEPARPSPAAKLAQLPEPPPEDDPVGNVVMPVRIRGSNMTAPEVLERYEPEFPRWARERGLATYVILELVVDRFGRVRDASALRPVDPELDRLAAEAALRWRLTPGTRNGQPVDVYFNVTLQFRQ